MIRPSTVYAVDEWQPIAKYDSLYGDDDKCANSGTQLMWSVIRYSNGHVEWVLMCPDCGYQPGRVITGDNIVTNIYSRRYSDVWWHIQYEIRASAKRGASVGLLDLLAELYREFNISFRYGIAGDTKEKIRGVDPSTWGIYTYDIGKTHSTKLKRYIEARLKEIGYNIGKYPTFKNDEYWSDGGLFTSTS